MREKKDEKNEVIKMNKDDLVKVIMGLPVIKKTSQVAITIQYDRNSV